MIALLVGLVNGKALAVFVGGKDPNALIVLGFVAFLTYGAGIYRGYNIGRKK